MFFTTAIKNIFTAIIPLINIAGLGIVIEILVSGNEKKVIKIIIIYLSINLGISLIKAIIVLLNNVVMRKASDIVQLNYMYDCVFINYHYVQDGSILDLKRKSIGAHPVWLLDSLGNLFLYLIQFIGVTYIFALISPLFILVIVLTSFLTILMNFVKQKYEFDLQQAKVTDDRKLEYLYRTMTEYKYAKEIRVNQAGKFILIKYAKILNNQLDKLRIYYRKTLSVELIITIIAVLQALFMYCYFSYQVYTKQIVLSEYTILIGASTLLTSILIGFFECIAKINKTLKYTDLFREYRRKVQENSNIALGIYEDIEINWSAIEICFTHVSFKYPGSDRMILKDINFKIKQGEKIGIVGLNGSGKTTLIKLLCRTYDPTEGVITINGVDIRKIPINEYVPRIGIVLQDYFLFAYSVLENIVFDKCYDGIKLKDAIKKCGLSDKIESLHNGIDTPLYKELDDNGIEFSGGEGQKLALCRAIYKNASLFILDEPSSTSDPIAEHELFSNLANLSHGKTTLFISHRLSSMKYCDRIFVLTDSHVVESGSHEELINKQGYYADLFISQAKYYNR